MKVELFGVTPNAVKVAFTAIRTCYSAYDFDHIWNNNFNEYLEQGDDHLRLIKQIVASGHTSTLEHIQFNFSVEGVSRALLAQLTRHRVGFSYSVQSQRYVKMSSGSKHGKVGTVIPPAIENNQAMNYQFNNLIKESQRVYDMMISQGVAPEDARYILPNAATTNLIVSCNLRAFLDFYKKRNTTTHAQWEIQNLAEEMKNKILEAEPWTKVLFERN